MSRHQLTGIVAVTVAVLTLAGGGGVGADPIAPGVSLPRVGTLGDLPGEGERIIVVADAEGRLRVKGADLDLHGLAAFLPRAARDPKRREPDGSSRWNLVLAADGMLPWGAVTRILRAASGPNVRMYRVFFAVLPEHGDEEGGLATFLPKDRGLAPTSPLPPAAEPPRHVRVRMGAGTQDPAALYALLRTPAGNVRGRRVQLQADDLTPTGFVLRVVDVLFRSGAAGVDFVASAPDEDPNAIRRLVDEAAGDPRTPGIELRGVDIGTLPSTPMPAVDRVKGRFAGDAGTGTGPMPSPALDEDLPEMPEEVIPTEPGRGLPLEEGIEPGDGIADAPFEGPGGPFGIGGGAGGAFKGRGGSRDLHAGAGGRKQVDDAIEHALKWLAAHQSPDGGWEAAGFTQWCDGKLAGEGRRPDGRGKVMYDPGVTGLALLAFLGAGYTNRGAHPFATVVGKGLRYLKNIQDAEGCFGPRTTQHYIYNHATAALAMVEAYGMTESPIFKGSAQKALDFITLARNPYFVWRYGVKPGDNDTSITGWMASVLLAARVINQHAVGAGRAAPLAIDDQAFEGVTNWLDKMTDKDYGRVGYITPGSGPARPQELVDQFPTERSESMTAVAVHLRTALGEPVTSEPIRKGMALCRRLSPTWNPNNGSIDMYYWFYGSLAAHGVGGEAWTSWRQALHAAVLPSQHQDTDYCELKGSWDAVDPWGPDGGRVYSTALMALCLETPWRAVLPRWR